MAPDTGSVGGWRVYLKGGCSRSLVCFLSEAETIEEMFATSVSRLTTSSICSS